MARVAIPVGEDFEDSELTVPRDRLTAAGHETVIIGAEAGRSVTGKRGRERVVIALRADDCDPASFDAVVIPGGYSPDHLRIDAGVVRFLREFGATGRTIAAVCHGPQLLIEADLVRGRTVTSWPSVRKDLVNAGAAWIDQAVVEEPLGQLSLFGQVGEQPCMDRGAIDAAIDSRCRGRRQFAVGSRRATI